MVTYFGESIIMYHAEIMATILSTLVYVVFQQCLNSSGCSRFDVVIFHTFDVVIRVHLTMSSMSKFKSKETSSLQPDVPVAIFIVCNLFLFRM